MTPDEDGMIDIPPYGMFKVAEPKPEKPDTAPHWLFKALYNEDGTVA